MKKSFLITIILAVSAILAACGGGEETVKVGISGTDTSTWDFVAEKAAEEGINIEIISFNDYVQPNTALADGELDINSFQTVAYFDEFIEERDLDLAPIATTYLAPMGLYSDSLGNPEEIPDGGKIALPNDVSNQGRALMLLEAAGLLTLVENYDGLGSISEAVVENPKDLELVATSPAQIPRALGDVDAGVINNGIARDAGFNPIEDSIHHEDETAVDYVNIIASRSEDTDDETLQRIAELFQEEDTKQFILEEHEGSLIPAFLPLEEIGW
ncbi:MetQ/NlpA family ABC transporter substrate-binding protein [Salinicoccus sp. HZC-1]|uniref:MetQ/NlpA family ABC transporter substrate-binding protein n=1 Tax=Salinicoccus sp. HZC-1 TaxID=3385497 RepID=UPI00398A5776